MKNKRFFLLSVNILLTSLIPNNSFAELSGDVKRYIQEIIAEVSCMERKNAWEYIAEGGKNGCEFTEKKEPCSIVNRVWWWKNTTFDIEKKIVNSPLPICFKKDEKDLSKNIIANKLIQLNESINGSKFSFETYLDINENIKIGSDNIGSARIIAVKSAHRTLKKEICRNNVNKEIICKDDKVNENGAMIHARKVYYEGEK